MKLTKEEIKVRNDLIRLAWKNRKSNVGYRYLGEKFGLSKSYITRIIQEKNIKWRPKE